jgi:hypothetical protein
MRKILLVLTAAIMTGGTAIAEEPLTNQQMDGVIAGVYVLCGCGNAAKLPPNAVTLPPTPTPTPIPGYQQINPIITSAMTPPPGQNPFQPYVGVPSSQYSGCNVYCGGLAQPAR